MKENRGGAAAHHSLEADRTAGDGFSARLERASSFPRFAAALTLHVAAMACVCLLSLACASTDTEPDDASPTSESTPVDAASSTQDDTVPSAEDYPLYGTYLRRVPDVEEKPPSDPGLEDEWALSFEESVEVSDGVLELYYLGRQPGSAWGRAYRYSSDDDTLHLSKAVKPERTRLRMGGFDCQPKGPASYAWSRSDDNRTLRLEAIAEPCATRHAILEGEWQFYD